MASVTALGYIGVAARDLDAWHRFGVDVLGFSALRRESALLFRMDGCAQRLFVEAGDLDDVSVLGWQVPDRRALEEIGERLAAAHVVVSAGTPAECERRNVDALIKLSDPAGIPLELFCGLKVAKEPFASTVVRSGFVTGEQGMGHVVVNARNQQESQRFYSELLGFRLSDQIVADVHGHRADIVFLHANSRHHSLAIGEGQRKRIHHFMVEVASFDDVGLGFDRALKNGARIMQTLGRHPNDRMFSFYARTPSGFQFEYGWGGRQVDDATWQPTRYDHISEWGHHPPQFLAPPPRPST